MESKEIRLILEIAVVVLLAVIATSNLYPPKRPLTRYEYMVDSSQDSMVKGSLETLGREGWEVISVRRIVEDVNRPETAGMEFILKRPLPERSWFAP